MKNIYTSRQVQRNNYSGKTGVFWDKVNHKWIARIKFQGKDRHLGTYKEFDDAVDARETAEYACNIFKGLNIVEMEIELSRYNPISITGIITKDDLSFITVNVEGGHYGS